MRNIIFNTLAAGPDYYYYIVKHVKEKSDINKQDLKIVTLHFVRSE